MNVSSVTVFLVIRLDVAWFQSKLTFQLNKTSLWNDSDLVHIRKQWIITNKFWVQAKLFVGRKNNRQIVSFLCILFISNVCFHYVHKSEELLVLFLNVGHTHFIFDLEKFNGCIFLYCFVNPGTFWRSWKESKSIFMVLKILCEWFFVNGLKALCGSCLIPFLCKHLNQIGVEFLPFTIVYFFFQSTNFIKHRNNEIVF